MNIGFVGFGEASYSLAKGLSSEGLNKMKAFDANVFNDECNSLIKKRSNELNMKVTDSYEGFFDDIDYVFVAVPAFVALDACKEISNYIKDTCTYVDVSASSPAIKDKCKNILDEKNISYIDASMLGSLPKLRHKVPFYVSGEKAKRFIEDFEKYGMNITYVNEKPGSATSIKLIRSIFMKGISALMIELVMASDSYGVSDFVLNSISDSLDGISFMSHLNRISTGSAIHAKRRAFEIGGSIEMLEDKNLDSLMSEATKKKLEILANYDFSKVAEKDNKTWKDVVSVLKGVEN